jgi:putative spermidine/putrescine transport system substrate-binding protein
VPDEGMLAFEVGFYLIKNAPARAEALKYLNYVLSVPNQTRFTEVLAGALPVNSKVAIPAAQRADTFIVENETRHILQWDWVRANKQMPEITEAWNRTIK